jgi:hypothetical protein
MGFVQRSSSNAPLGSLQISRILAGRRVARGPRGRDIPHPKQTVDALGLGHNASRCSVHLIAEGTCGGSYRRAKQPRSFRDERSRQDLTHPICLSLLAYLLGLHSIQIGLVQIGLAKTCTRNCHVGLGV